MKGPTLPLHFSHAYDADDNEDKESEAEASHKQPKRETLATNWEKLTENEKRCAWNLSLSLEM